MNKVNKTKEALLKLGVPSMTAEKLWEEERRK